MPFAHILSALGNLGNTWVDAKREQQEREMLNALIAEALAPKVVTPAVAPVPPQINLPPPQMGIPGTTTPFGMPQNIMGGQANPMMEQLGAMIGGQMSAPPSAINPGAPPPLAVPQPSYEQMFTPGTPGTPEETEEPQLAEMLRRVMLHPLARRIPRDTLKETIGYITGIGQAMPAPGKPGEGQFTLSPGQTRFNPSGQPLAEIPDRPEKPRLRAVSPGQTIFDEDTGQPIFTMPEKVPLRDQMFVKAYNALVEAGGDMNQVPEALRPYIPRVQTLRDKLVELNDLMVEMGQEGGLTQEQTLKYLGLSADKKDARLISLGNRVAAVKEIDGKLVEVGSFKVAPAPERPGSSGGGREYTLSQQDARNKDTEAVKDAIRQGKLIYFNSYGQETEIKVTKENLRQLASQRYPRTDFNDPEILRFLGGSAGARAGQPQTMHVPGVGPVRIRPILQ